jgi:hypothetical protein
MVDGAEINLCIRRLRSFEGREEALRIGERRQMQEIDAAARRPQSSRSAV